MVKKNYSLVRALKLIVLVIAFSLVAYLVLALGNGIIIINPESNTNYSSNFIVNCSYINNSVDILNPLYQNTTFYVNQSDVWQPLSNITSYNITNFSVSFVVNITNITDSKGLAFNCTIGNETALAPVFGGNITTGIMIDDTPPAISTPILPVTGGNYSGSIVLNVSIIDPTAGISTIYFNVTNSSGGQNGTYTASNQGNYWNATINTSKYIGGIYNITVYANDSLSLNSTLVSSNVTFDNTAPIISSFSCSPSSVTLGEVVTCTCSVSDALSGVNTLSYSSTTTPSTASPGTFTVTCTPADNAGNSATADTTYTITDVGGSTSSGGGASTWTSTSVVTAEQFQEGYTKQLGVKNRLKIAVENNDHYVGITALTTSTVTLEIRSTPQQATLSVGDLRRFDVTNDSYYDLSVKLESISNSKANLTIKSIHEEVTVETIEEEQQEEQEATGTEGEVEPPPQGRSYWWIWIIVIIVIAVGVVAFFLIKNKRK